MVNSPGNKALKKAVNYSKIIPEPIIPPRRIETGRIALVIGGADCLQADMAAALAWFTPACLIAINNIGYDHPEPIDHWVTMHPDKMPEWVRKRRANGYPDAGTLWRPRHRQDGKGLEMRDCPSWGGSSGLFAVAVSLLALEMPCVLAGVPMQEERAHYDNPKPWTDCRHYLAHWRRYLPQMQDRVRSMSGWTKDLLGAPDEAWFRCPAPSKGVLKRS